MIYNDATDDEIVDYIQAREHIRVEILGTSQNHGTTFCLVKWQQEANISDLRAIACNQIINQRGVDITHRFENPDTVNTRILRKIQYRFRKHHLPVPRMVSMLRYGGIRHNKRVNITCYNVYIICNGFGCFRFSG